MIRSSALRYPAWSVVLLLLLGGSGCSVGQARPERDSPVSVREAEELLARTVALATAGRFTELCRSVAASEGNCRPQLEIARHAGTPVGHHAPVVVSTSVHDSESSIPTRVLHLEGRHPDGETYRADFAVIRPRPGEPVRSLTPVYWAEVMFSPQGGHYWVPAG